MLPRMRCAVLVLGCLLLAPGTWATAGEETGFVDLGGATVLASPGTPEGLHPFLPGGRAPQRLAWPLPDGPVLVLGLPGSDPAARDLAFFWDLLAPGEDLHGGFLVAAWHDGTRPIGVILADDAAALYAARFALEAAPALQGMPMPDFTKPPAEATLRIRRGRRVTRPQFRIRAYHPKAATPESVLAAIAGRANRFWFHARDGERAAAELPRLVRHGIAPCVVLAAGSQPPRDLERRLAPWFRRDVRHVVLSPAGFDVQVDDIERHVDHLRATFDLREIAILDPRIRVPATLGTWLPELLDWRRLTADRIRAATAEGPVLFLDGWARVARSPIPSRPRGRPPELGRLVEGVVVLSGPGAVGVLEDAWARGAEQRAEWEIVLLPLLPRGDDEPRAFLERTAKQLAALDVPTRRAVDWLDPLLGRVRSSLDELHARAVLVPRAPAPVRLDGALDEPVWGYARTFAFPLPADAKSRSGTLLAVSNGRDLHVALRLPEDLPPLRLVLGCSATGPAPGAGIGDAARPDVGAMRRTDTTRTWEGVLGHFELAGDAHPTRVFHLWHQPKEGKPQRLGSLVLGP